jgi:hypothetical protein
MLFYGRLKNLNGAELHAAVREGLKQVRQDEDRVFAWKSTGR